MTLAEYEDIGTWDYYVHLIKEMGLVEEFEEEWEATLGEFELDVSESIVIEETLERADDEYLLLIREYGPAYRVLALAE